MRRSSIIHLWTKKNSFDCVITVMSSMSLLCTGNKILSVNEFCKSNNKLFLAFKVKNCLINFTLQ